ncbi:hypothetical protein J1605_004361 [Eschrichtius robustus]|uniref:Uncharacterized protein n=1 Tax=Eschrichtius robustus TaxID=9764 RepID=A0AB34HL97_ESCRO|nr:hypothetical protein J1605_004361 [Eschrichtius robustus]
MVVVVLLWLGWLCAPLGALVLDVNNIKSSADAQGARKDKREKAVLELSTVDLDFAVLVIFGLKFVNRSHWRDRSALGEDTKIPRKLQKSSSAVTVVLDYHVEVRRLEINNTHG